jgi:hypothetical protein
MISHFKHLREANFDHLAIILATLATRCQTLAWHAPAILMPISMATISSPSPNPLPHTHKALSEPSERCRLAFQSFYFGFHSRR